MDQKLNAAVSVESKAMVDGQRTLHWAAVVMMLGLIGCGSGEPAAPQLGVVKGKVTINGAPAEGLVVTFNPQGGSNATVSTGQTDAQGEYQLIYVGSSTGLKGAVVGDHVVRIESRATDEPTADGRVLEPIFIPDNYNGNSELKAKVVAGENPPINFDLQIPKQ